MKLRDLHANDHHARRARKGWRGHALSVALVWSVFLSGAIAVCGPQSGTGKAATSRHMAHKHSSSVSSQPTGDESTTKIDVPDVQLLNQDGKAIHFYSDLVKGKVVVINFIFTNCTTICPPMGATFSRLQTLLGDRLGKDVRLISVSVDPVTDTPRRLKIWAAKFHAGPGWELVTGKKQVVDKLLRALQSSSPDPQSHSPLVLIGNDLTGVWTRAYGLAAADKLAALVKKAEASSAQAESN